MRNIRLDLQYDGSAFEGFQKQNREGARTVQGELEKTLERLLGAKIKTVTAGRTDTGVHATGQVVSFRTDSPMSSDAMRGALNEMLPDDIAVQGARDVELSFHARHSAVKRKYHYYILNCTNPSPFGSRYFYHIKRPMSLEPMKTASCYLLGENDFTSFSTSIKEVGTPVRRLIGITITSVKEWHERGNPVIVPASHDLYDNLILLEIEGTGFLRRMVRMMVATLVRVGLGKMEPEEVRRILEARDPGLVHTPAPPGGLYLVKVHYHEGEMVNLEED
ncbi:MAG: tRNA pseudouridine(38-40) synthase TruA [Vulcanimicrobiota bacterium]